MRRGDEEEAIERHTRRTLAPPGEIFPVYTPEPRGGLDILGRMHAITYTGTLQGDGPHLYEHKFDDDAAPLVGADQRGQLFILGGNYTTTERGITDINPAGLPNGFEGEQVNPRHQNPPASRVKPDGKWHRLIPGIDKDPRDLSPEYIRTDGGDIVQTVRLDPELEQWIALETEGRHRGEMYFTDVGSESHHPTKQAAMRALDPSPFDNPLPNRSHRPPQSVRDTAAAALERRSMISRARKGGTRIGVGRGRQLARGGPVSDRTLARMRSFFARHDTPQERRARRDPMSPAAIAWDLWGGDPGRMWADSKRTTPNPPPPWVGPAALGAAVGYLSKPTPPPETGASYSACLAMGLIPDDDAAALAAALANIETEEAADRAYYEAREQGATISEAEAIAAQIPRQNPTLLPLAPENKKWSAAAARKRIKRWATKGKKTDWDRYARAFLYRDPAHPSVGYGFKLPIADVIKGELKAVPHAIEAAAAVLDGARGGVDISRSAHNKARRWVEAYYRKMGKTPPWPPYGPGTPKR